MPKELVLIKVGDGVFQTASEQDQIESSSWKVGQTIKAEVIKWSARSLINHRRYWALLLMTLKHYKPVDTLFTDKESECLGKYTDVLLRSAPDSGDAFKEVERIVKQEITEARKAYFQTPKDGNHKSGLHCWVKVEAGYYSLLQTPGGVRKEPLSINFNAMAEADFKDFYRAVFQVCWKLVLSSAYETADEAQRAAQGQVDAEDRAFNEFVGLAQ